MTYHDTDRMGHAYHANHLVWFEIGRTELLRGLGQSYRSWEEERGVYLPVRRATVEYLKPVLYDDLLIVETRVVELTRIGITFDYRLQREQDRTLLATGRTEHVFINREGRIIRNATSLLPELFAS